MMTNYSQDLALLMALLKVYACIHLDQGEAMESEDPQSHENWILFPSKAYVLKFASTLGERLCQLQAHALSGLCHSIP